jgi:ribonuclease P protein component
MATGWIGMSSGHPERLGRNHRLRFSREFALIKTAGRPLRGRNCLLLVLAQPGEPTRVGFIASGKGVGGAVQRNRARRRLREIVRRRWPRIPHTGCWLVLIASRSTLTASHEELVSEVERLLAGAGALAPAVRGQH